ncbi:unnamed protein product [Angiostrongylus costaricensis]|uniref:Nuclear RNA export factor 1 n=1 Tax=Angiostrongylus costaricensis TaxID=334426 RepID=A0A0R3PCA4_ANGCS|nr:unnamed protein product [Angiostrongylus costaricensis]
MCERHEPASHPMPISRYNRHDVKHLSKNRFSRLDADIASSYVDDEEGEERPRPKQGTVTRVINMLAGRVMHGQGLSRRGKKDEQTLRSAAGVARNTEIVYKIKIPFGRKFAVPWIMKQLHQQIEDIKPLLVSTTPRGDVEFLLKAVVDSRYNHETRSLDLSEFALDQQFKDRDLHMMLNKNNVMLTVVDRIDEKFGSITALSLQGNRLRFLDYAAVLTSVTKFLKVLDLSNNQIDKIGELEKLKGLPVETLFFEGNPLVEQLTTASGYLRSIVMRVQSRDGAPVQPASTHVPSLDDDDVTSEPPCGPGFYGNDNLRVLVERFLVEYFKLYDGEDGAATRKNLVQAYDQENALFVDFTDLIVLSIVLAIIHMFEYRIMLYGRKGGRETAAPEPIEVSTVIRRAMDIAVALSKLPITNHYTESFIVDTHLISEELMAFSVQGLFEDGKFAKAGEVPQLNFFTRSFIVSPRENESVAVLSDMLYISGISSARIARYKLMLNKALSVRQPLPSTSTGDSVLNAAQSIDGLQMSSQLSPELKRQMVEQFCKDSGMIASWSEKCLVDYDWNYEAAGQAFLCNKDNIPKEAFGSP